MTSNLDPSPEDVERWLSQMSEFILTQLLATPSAPAMGQMGDAGRVIAEEISAPIGEDPLDGGWDEVYRRIERGAEASLGTQVSGYLAYVPGGGLVSSAMAALISGVLNRYTGIAEAAPAFVRLEWDVIRWFAHSFGFDDKARGILTSGGSMANFSAILAARHQFFGDSGDFREACVYVSSQVHHCVSKSVRLAGIPRANIRVIPVDEHLRMDVEALRRSIQEDGDRQPFLVVASAGTTNTGVVDPLRDVARLCRELGLWFHVDGAYGATFALCEAGRAVLGGLEEADSITFDPHKGLFLPYGIGGLVVRDGRALAEAHQSGAGYLQDLEEWVGEDELPSPATYSPELSRPFRGLQVWVPLMIHGAGAFRNALSEKLEMAQTAYTRLSALELDCLGAPELSAFGFRLHRGPHEDLTQWNLRNRAFMQRINALRRIHLSSTLLPVEDGLAFTLRVCVVSFRTTQTDIDHLVADVRASLPNKPG